MCVRVYFLEWQSVVRFFPVPKWQPAWDEGRMNNKLWSELDSHVRSLFIGVQIISYWEHCACAMRLVTLYIYVQKNRKNYSYKRNIHQQRSHFGWMEIDFRIHPFGLFKRIYSFELAAAAVIEYNLLGLLKEWFGYHQLNFDVEQNRSVK